MTGCACTCGSNEEDLASAFIVSTCELIPRSSPVLVEHMHNLLPSPDREPKQYSILCGSNAEFYIRPLMTCIDDADNLIAKTDELAFGGDFPVLPSNLSGLADKINCFMTEPYNIYPGFVRLRLLGELNYNWNCNKYEFNYASDTNSYKVINMADLLDKYFVETLNRTTNLNILSGPALQHRSDGPLIAIDVVISVWCPQWPKEAQGWLNRSRLNGWPTSDTISEVVQSGCHVVYIQHRSCRNDKFQWRFSFSVAEVILLQSWTQIQQIVYHLLRFFAKRELIQKDCPKEHEVLCPYHLKTLMLWTCEEMSRDWWNSVSITAICSELLKRLSEWLKKTLKQLNTFSKSEILSHWFTEYYILFFIRIYFQPVEQMPHFVHYVLPLFESWKVNQLESLEFNFFHTFGYFHMNCRSIMKRRLNSGLRHCQMMQDTCRSIQLIEMKVHVHWRLRYLTTMQDASCFTYQKHLLHILYTAYGLVCGEISWDGSLFIEFLNAMLMQPKIIKSQYHNFPTAYTALRSRFQFLCSQKFLENLTGSNNLSEFKLLSLVTKQFLIKSLTYDGTIGNGIGPASLVYLAALCFGTSKYQEATRLCLVVLMAQTSEEDKESLNAGCLLFIDDIARIVGLCVLQKKITENNLNFTNRRIYIDLRISADVFAQHLNALSTERMYKQSYFYCDLPDSTFPMDINIKTLTKPKFISSMKSGYGTNADKHIVYRRPDSPTEFDNLSVNETRVKERIIGILVEYALENMTSFYNAIHKDVGVDCKTINCYRALCRYKCRQYDQVLHLCEGILKDSDLKEDLKEFPFANVLLLPPLDFFFDRDVQFLLGFRTLFHYLSPLNNVLGAIEFTAESTFEHWFARYVCREKLDFVSILPKPYSVRSHYFLGRHFLARYLKLRCHIDRNLPFQETLDEFVNHKCSLPFEHIIRKFMLR